MWPHIFVGDWQCHAYPWSRAKGICLSHHFLVAVSQPGEILLGLGACVEGESDGVNVPCREFSWLLLSLFIYKIIKNNSTSLFVTLKEKISLHRFVVVVFLFLTTFWAHNMYVLKSRDIKEFILSIGHKYIFLTCLKAKRWHLDYFLSLIWIS